MTDEPETPKGAPPRAPVPEWVGSTPPEYVYVLEMRRGDFVEQQVIITRKEFVDCKAIIADMRGHRLISHLSVLTFRKVAYGTFRFVVVASIIMTPLKAAHVLFLPWWGIAGPPAAVIATLMVQGWWRRRSAEPLP